MQEKIKGIESCKDIGMIKSEFVTNTQFPSAEILARLYDHVAALHLRSSKGNLFDRIFKQFFSTSLNPFSKRSYD